MYDALKRYFNSHRSLKWSLWHINDMISSVDMLLDIYITRFIITLHNLSVVVFQIFCKTDQCPNGTKSSLIKPIELRLIITRLNMGKFG